MPSHAVLHDQRLIFGGGGNRRIDIAVLPYLRRSTASKPTTAMTTFANPTIDREAVACQDAGDNLTARANNATSQAAGLDIADWPHDD